MFAVLLTYLAEFFAKGWVQMFWNALHGIVQLAPPSPQNPYTVTFGWWEYLRYFYYQTQRVFDVFSWQVRLCITLSIASIVVMVVLYSMFLLDAHKRNSLKRKEDKWEEKYIEAFRTILANDSMPTSEMELILGETREELRRTPASFFQKLLANVRMEMFEIIYLPNLQPLADLVGVREHMELCLLRRKDVFQTLQVLLMFQLIISEGRLANYVNANDTDIRMLARLCYILCSENEPYRYLLDDLDAPQSQIRPMLLHYIFGWMKEKERRMPEFLTLAERIKNEDMSAFMINEVAYWGTDNEKAAIRNYFSSPKLKCRQAAISAAGLLGDAEAEPLLIASYDEQPEHIKRTILQTLLSIRSGNCLEFFEKIYRTTPSSETKELAISSLYQYNYAGRRRFEEIRQDADEDSRVLFEQIDAANMLVAIQNYF